MAKPNMTNSILPADSIVLVTGANGLIASHACDQMLAAGFRVRGTVRDAKKSAWLEPLFAQRHGSGRFELVEIPDLAVPGVWNDCIKGVSGVAHTVAVLKQKIEDVDEELKAEIPLQRGLLEAAKNESSVKSFVMTSSAWAAWTPNAARKTTLTTDSWNDEAIAVARDKSIPTAQKGWPNFMALKTLVEQYVWEWVKTEKPSFNFNTLLLETVIGECLDPKNQGVPSTAGFIGWVWEGVEVATLNSMQPQWHCDSRDAGKLHVAALALPGVSGERIYGFGARFSWYRVGKILEELHPEYKMTADIKDNGWDQTDVPNQRGEEMLRLLGQEGGWTSLEDSVRANIESWFASK